MKVHIATIHWPYGKWMDIQHYYLEKNLGSEYNYYAVVNKDTKVVEQRFNYVSKSTQANHSKHLNHLLSYVLESSADENEILVFLDGDAFPVAPLHEYLENSLEEYPLIAIQRLENVGEFIPHPSFCAAKIGFWKELGPIWGEMRTSHEFGKDPGGNLFDRLKDKGMNWGKLMRTNQINLHPLFFGIYDNLIYHHGAGFRDPISRVDLSELNQAILQQKFLSRIAEIIPAKFLQGLKRRISPFRKEEYKIILQNRLLQDDVYNQIISNKEFYKRFI
ncbi:hypothetical protein ACFLTA_02955 [Bacteroidota bacterium]